MLKSEVVRGINIAGVKIRYFAWAFLVFVATHLAHADSPFVIRSKVEVQGDLRRLELRFDLPERYVLYADKLSFEWIGGSYSNAFALPVPSTIVDKTTQHEKRAFASSFSASCLLPSSEAAYPLTLEVHLQGCDDANCFFPEERKFRVAASGTVSSISDEEPPSMGVGETPGVTTSGEWQALASQFTVGGRGSGYLGEKDFIGFLEQARSGKSANAPLVSFATGWSALLSVLLILLGGMALNLTPCVLPLIPINLAIIGAGSRAGSRARGFALGGAYASGMALAYGILGLVVVLTGSKFGTLNSSPWFNVTIGGVFVLLALGMFDRINIDFSRITGGTATRARGSKGSFILAYSMGTIAALLAGACVAPVVISVLLQATKLYSGGVFLGLALPFVLGIGMALPWPFLGAGLSFMPKPGGWMAKVKYGFGALITVFAAYYFYLAFGLFRSDSATATPLARSLANSGESSLGDPSTELSKTLAAALGEGKPVFIDFWASWCKNCSAMEHTTFQRQSVVDQLSQYKTVRLQAEKPNQQPLKSILDYFGAMGLPTYVVLIPKSSLNTNTHTTSAALHPQEGTPHLKPY